MSIMLLTVPTSYDNTIDVSQYPGVVRGEGLSDDARIENGIAIQGAINAAAQQQKFLVVPPGIYEFHLPGGLIVDSEGFTWMGSRNTVLVQFAVNSPVITLGKIVSNSDGPLAMNIDGLTARYGVDQTGQVNANAIVMASSWISSYSRLYAGYKASAKYFSPYRSIYFNGNGTDKFWFSNSLRDSLFGHAQYQIWRHNLLSTGCLYENIYIGGGAPNITPYPTSVVSFSEGGGRGQGSIFNQFNIEWCSGNCLLELNNCRQYVFNSLHIEGCKVTGDLAGFVYLNLSEVSINGFDLENCQVKSSDISYGTPRVIKSYSQSKAVINSMRLGWLTVAGSDTNVDRSFSLYEPGSDGDSSGARCIINNFYFEGGGSYGTIGSITTGNTPYPTGGNFTFDGNESYFSNAYYRNIDTDLTIYGSCRNPAVKYAAALTTNRTLVLSGKKGSTGWKANTPIDVGSTVYLYRQSGTAANTVTVKNLTSDGTTLVINDTANTEYRFRFDGANWSLL